MRKMWNAAKRHSLAGLDAMIGGWWMVNTEQPQHTADGSSCRKLGDTQLDTETLLQTIPLPAVYKKRTVVSHSSRLPHRNIKPRHTYFMRFHQHKGTAFMGLRSPIVHFALATSFLALQPGRLLYDNESAASYCPGHSDHCRHSSCAPRCYWIRDNMSYSRWITAPGSKSTCRKANTS